MLEVDHRVIANHPDYRRDSDGKGGEHQKIWFAGTVESVDVASKTCAVKFDVEEGVGRVGWQEHFARTGVGWQEHFARAGQCAGGGVKGILNDDFRAVCICRVSLNRSPRPDCSSQGTDITADEVRWAPDASREDYENRVAQEEMLRARREALVSQMEREGMGAEKHRWPATYGYGEKGQTATGQAVVFE